MKRRDFILSGVVGLVGMTIAGKTLASVVWAKPGAMGYKEVAPSPAKNCSNCGWYQKDASTPDGGICRFSGIQAAAKSKVVHVKASGVCTMWKKA